VSWVDSHLGQSNLIDPSQTKIVRVQLTVWDEHKKQALPQSWLTIFEEPLNGVKSLSYVKANGSGVGRFWILFQGD
jgi:hypothetical protein